ncbi:MULTISPECIES: AMP-dependent synthetase/ligase [Streptomyces]|uniref:Acyl-CoA synthetase n=1 Tax=Streptomyces eurythermus TaxID=42237 RepID=A0ABW6Z7D5_9ACTN|nr:MULTISPECIES: AMP-dependent synthetase/ligase [Streptomyces]QIS75082.1 long-chain fatty acid--CoA ligase [Streptomyces sp. DSM 40868]
MSKIDAPTIGQLSILAAHAFGPRTALRYKRHGAWHTVTYRQLADAVDRIATGLLRLGVQPGDRVGLFAETRHEWTLCDLAIARAGAVSVPVYPTSTPEECAWLLDHAAARTVLCDTAARAETAATCPGVKTVIAFEDEAPAGCRTLAELRNTVPADTDRQRLDSIADGIGTGDLSTVIYTSGTTGRPKGCMITHDNWRAAGTAISALLDGLGDGEEVYLHLPLSHIMSRTIQFVALSHGAALAYFGGDIRNVIAELAEVRPTILPSVPRLFEKAHAAVKDLPPQVVADAIGGRVRLAATGAAPMDPAVLDFFASCGIPILDTYGMTESTALMTANLPGDIRYGTVGRPLPGVEIRIADDGEILTRGAAVFAGYLDNPEATAEVMTDGWLRTGDLGELDADGYLTVTGRKKDLIITATGKNIAPSALENALRLSPHISQAVVIGDRRPHLAVLVTLDPDTVTAWATEHNIPGTWPELARHPEVKALVQAELDKANARFPPVARARALAVLDRDFTVEDGTLTPSLKVRRNQVATRYAALIDTLYGTS